MTQHSPDHSSALLTPDDKQLADDYLRWLVVLTLGTIAGCLALVLMIYLVRPQWVAAFLEAM